MGTSGPPAPDRSALPYLCASPNAIGLGFGPQTIGLVSDLLRPRYGAESLRYALVGVSLLNVRAAFHYFMAGRTLPADLDRAKAAEAAG